MSTGTSYRVSSLFWRIQARMNKSFFPAWDLVCGAALTPFSSPPTAVPPAEKCLFPPRDNALSRLPSGPSLKSGSLFFLAVMFVLMTDCSLRLPYAAPLFPAGNGSDKAPFSPPCVYCLLPMHRLFSPNKKVELLPPLLRVIPSRRTVLSKLFSGIFSFASYSPFFLLHPCTSPFF